MRLLAQTQLDGGLAYAVYALLEADGRIFVGEAAVDATGDVNQRGIDEVHRLRLAEVPCAAL